jgi:glutamate-5-semialdehyde dehydrogenase
MASIDKQMQLLGSQARAAAETLAFSTFEQRSLAVSEGAKSISNQIDLILSANEIDMSNARGQGLDDAMLDRLYLDRTRVESIASSLQAISELPDPLGRVLSQWERPSGLKIRRVTTPLGVIGVIYESRPNVTADAGALCLMGATQQSLEGDLRALILQKQFLTVYSMVCNWQTYLSHRFKWCLLKIVKP